MAYEEEKNMGDLQEEVRELKSLIMDLKHIIQFHELDRIPKRYIRTFAKKGEYPFIELREPIKKEIPSIFKLGFPSHGSTLQELDFPKDPEEFKKAQQRMLYEYQSGENAKRVNEIFECASGGSKRLEELIKQQTSEELIIVSYQLEGCTLLNRVVFQLEP